MTRNDLATGALMIVFIIFIGFILVATASPSERPEAFYQQTALTQ